MRLVTGMGLGLLLFSEHPTPTPEKKQASQRGPDLGGGHNAMRLWFIPLCRGDCSCFCKSKSGVRLGGHKGTHFKRGSKIKSCDIGHQSGELSFCLTA
jgi:hypothetical protein